MWSSVLRQSLPYPSSEHQIRENKCFSFHFSPLCMLTSPWWWFVILTNRLNWEKHPNLRCLVIFKTIICKFHYRLNFKSNHIKSENSPTTGGVLYVVSRYCGVCSTVHTSSMCSTGHTRGVNKFSGRVKTKDECRWLGRRVDNCGWESVVECKSR